MHPCSRPAQGFVVSDNHGNATIAAIAAGKESQGLGRGAAEIQGVPPERLSPGSLRGVAVWR